MHTPEDAVTASSGHQSLENGVPWNQKTGVAPEEIEVVAFNARVQRLHGLLPATESWICKPRAHVRFPTGNSA